MRFGALAAAWLLVQTGMQVGRPVEAAPEHFRYQRAVTVPALTKGTACAVVDAALYAHADARLNAMRLYAGGREVPFALTESGEAGQAEEPAKVMNLGRQGKAIVFDLAMPQRMYTEVVLDLDGKDFYATAKVSGSDGKGGASTELGKFALYDLRSAKLSRSTTLALQEASFAVLHVELNVTPAPGGDEALLGPQMVKGASVPPSREAQTLYTAVAMSGGIEQKGHDSVATFDVPAHVPVERVAIALQPDFQKNFSRKVRVTADVVAPEETTVPEIVGGEIHRVKLPGWGGQEIRSEQMSVEAILASNQSKETKVEVAIENGDDAPLPIASVALEMRERKICFEAEPGSEYVLRYGDAAPVRAAVYDYARLFRASAAAAVATLGAETMNAGFSARKDNRPYTERHPELLWVVLLAVVAVLGIVAVRSAKRQVQRK